MGIDSGRVCRTLKKLILEDFIMQFVMTNFGSVNPQCFGTGKGEAPQEVKIDMINLMKRIVKAFDLKDAVDVAFSECFENKWVGKENFLYSAIQEGMVIRKRQEKSFIDFYEMQQFLEDQIEKENATVLEELFGSWIPVILIAMKYYYFIYDASEQERLSTRAAMRKIDESTFTEKYNEDDPYSVGERNFHGMMRRIFDEEVDFIKALCKDESHCYEISMAKLYLYVELHVKKVERLLAKTQKTQEISEIVESSALPVQEKEVKDNITKSKTQKEVDVQPEEKTKAQPKGPSLEECEKLLEQAREKGSIDETLGALKLCQDGMSHEECTRQFRMEELVKAEERLKQAKKAYEDAQFSVKEAEDTIKAWRDMLQTTKEQAQDLLNEKVGEST